MTWLIDFKCAVSKAARRFSPNCREAARLQSCEHDRPLSWSERIGLRIHLFLCHWCRRYGKQLGFLRRAIHDHPKALNPPAPETLTPEVRERLKESLRQPK